MKNGRQVEGFVLEWKVQMGIVSVVFHDLVGAANVMFFFANRAIDV
jgi:hypothetical protein